MGPRAICVTRDAEVRRAVGGALAGAGVAVEHHDALADAGPAGAALLVVDRATREAAGAALCGAGVPVVVVGDDLEDDALFALMLEAPVSHLVRDPADHHVRITSQKLVSGDLFGLEKYIAAGAAIGQRVVADERERRAAMAEVCAWAETIGARAPVVHRIASVIDELAMNALIDAPRRAGAPANTARATVRWTADEGSIAISVGDEFGALRQRDVIANVRRARDEHGRPQPGEPGAGLGLYLVLANVASLVVNVELGRRTEVVCLFDLVRGSRPAIAGGVRTLSVFEARS